MKKSIVLLTIVALMFVMTTSVFANTEADTPYVYRYDNITVIFEENTPFDSAQREHIALVLTQGDAEAAPCGILCLFGHKYETGIVRTITHNVNSTQPKCMEETFEIGECTRCGDTTVDRLGYDFIVCCE